MARWYPGAQRECEIIICRKRQDNRPLTVEPTDLYGIETDDQASVEAATRRTLTY